MLDGDFFENEAGLVSLNYAFGLYIIIAYLNKGQDVFRACTPDFDSARVSYEDVVEALNNDY
jgi:hypothetical protein